MKKLAVLTILTLILTGLTAAGTISVSEVDYNSDSSFYSEDHLLIEFNVDGTSETLHTEIDSSTISDASEGDTDQDVEISVDLLDKRAEYEVSDQGLRQIDRIQFVDEEFSSESERDSWVDSQCMETDLNSVYQGNRLTLSGFVYYAGCAQVDFSEPQYNVGNIEFPADMIFEAEWSVNAEGQQTETAIITNDGTQEGQQERIGDHTQIEFLGLRDLGSEAPAPDNSYAAYSSQSGWKLIDQNDYNQYRNNVDDIIEDTIDEAGSSRGSTVPTGVFEDGEEQIDNLYDDASNFFTGSSINTAETPSTSTIDSGVWEYQPDSDFEWFTTDFLVRIDGANYLEIEKEFAEPNIIAVEEDAEVDGLGSDTAEITVENTGSGTGLFEAQVTCTGGFTEVGTSSQKSVDPGEIVSFYPLIDASGTEELSENCEFTVEDAETLDSDSTTFGASYSPENECSPGEDYWVETEDGNDVIYVCADDGISREVVETCGSDEHAVPEGSAYNCEEIDERDEIDLDENCEIGIPFTDSSVVDPVCWGQQQVSDTLDSFQNISFGLSLISTIMNGLVALLAGLLGWNVGNKYLAKALEVSDATDKEYLKTGLAFVLAVSFALIAYSLFVQWWVKLLLLIALTALLVFFYPAIKTMIGLQVLTRR